MQHVPSQAVETRLPGWKAQFGEVVYLPYGDIELVFRTIGVDHYEKLALANVVDNAIFTDEVVGEVLQECLLWPEGFELDDMPQSDFVALNHMLQTKSPFGDLEALEGTLERYRERYASPVTMMCAFVNAACPGLTLREIKKFTAHEIFEHLVVAEMILQKEFPIPNQKAKKPEPLSPDEVRAAKAKSALERREKAISRAKSNRNQRDKQHDFNPQGYDPMKSTAPTSRASHPSSIVSEFTDGSDLSEVTPGGAKRREFSDRDILKPQKGGIDFGAEAGAMGDLWDEPDRG